MKRMPNRSKTNDFFTTQKASHTVIIRLKDCPFHYGTDLGAQDTFLRSLDHIDRDEDVKSVLLFGPKEENGCERFFQVCRQTPLSDDWHVLFERMQNAVSQCVAKIVGLKKIVVHIDQRKSIPLFMNLGLGCDYRIVCDDASFHMRNLEMGCLPKGGEVFFLNRLVGYKKALSIFLFEKEISAEEALHMGFVDEVVPFSNLEEAGFRVVNDLSKKPAYILSAIKNMMNQFSKGLGDSLELEKRTFSALVWSKKFQEEMATCSWGHK